MTDKELLQQALAELLHLSDGLDAIEIIRAIRTRLAQPEPVAWQVKFRDDDGIPQIAWFPHPVHPESNLAKRSYIEEPLYTAPPKKEWVGLTDEERMEIWKERTGVSMFKKIEAKLKEKNHG